jgi:hypothetical protein
MNAARPLSLFHGSHICNPCGFKLASGGEDNAVVRKRVENDELSPIIGIDG